MLAYLKVVDKYPADYIFCQFGASSNGFPSPATHSQQPVSGISVSWGIWCNSPSQYGPAGLDLPFKVASNYVQQITINC